MKKSILFFFVFILCGFLTFTSGQSRQDFLLVNKTGVEIHQLHISPNTTDDWEEDILGKDVLANGEELEIKFHPKEGVCSWDMKITDKDGNSIEWEKIDLCKYVKIVLHYDGTNASAECFEE